MNVPFHPHQGLVIVEVEVSGPNGNAILRLAPDTGATSTLINLAPLLAIGYDPSNCKDMVQVTTGSGVEFVPRVTVTRLAALGLQASDFPVLCHTLPASADIDGLLGLYFLRGRILNIDFQQGQIDLI